ncbi:hypothetical protein NBRC10512_001178 [Rhodotorula toruloides]
MHLSILLSLVTTALPLALVDAAPAPAADVASTDSYRDDGHCGGGGGYGGKVDDWGRCGGKGYTGPTECKDGFYCKLWSEWYSQCIEKPHPYPPPPKTTISTTTWAPYPTYVPGGGKCNSWQKCESGFTCVKGHCVKDHKTSSTTSYKTSSTSKTPYPTHKPQCWSDKQCSYGEVCEYGWCVKDHKTSSTTLLQDFVDLEDALHDAQAAVLVRQAVCVSILPFLAPSRAPLLAPHPLARTFASSAL